ncbi:ReoY family proteolytic degradation factor [Halalkalibacter sp. APA_J-10(15)]|uniref:ReoY family proteolytic degradation factor n=1 Tax=unclassified Halalkalibacter TaxID=2893063 RepID=UPI001FF5B9D3|nr:ReoY family proteolytic degradation factor [Halalkalibacter sp. APA_J-10(15)]MCK0472106.1 ReoY family proteolytic degradation factor [Halalkalibacter sp. APA_J-10(15)]
MGHMISISEKKEFLKQFLAEFELKRRECTWLLNFLMSDDDLMKYVHFVEKAAHTPKGLIISAKGVDHLPFSFHKQHHVTTDTEKAFHDIRLNQSEDVYIELHFRGANRYSPFLTVLEENPYVPDDVELTKAYDKAATFILQRSLISYRRERLTREIDHALDKKDQDRFKMLLMELKKLDEEKEKK